MFLLRLLALPFLLVFLPGPASAAPPDDSTFPADALLPKKETGADRFLREFPKYDGRGVVVAIFDTGVDPGAPGLQTTTTGKPKIVDIVDASGSGDVDTSTKRSVRDDGTIEGLSGRSLVPSPKWRNPSGDWHIGQKPAWEIFPAGLVRRMKEERARKFDEKQREAVATAQRALADWDAAHEKPTTAELDERRDLVDRVDQLDGMMEDREDPGPVFDCLVFHDGNKWRAALDTDEDGEFADETTLTNYRDEHKWATFGDRDLLNYVLNVYEDGDRLSIVADAGSHGTHVAGIVAAHFPDRPELNGIAPGAQLVAVKIGDTRLGSTSVGTGDVRGYVAALANGADLVNMSYGGPTRIPNDGRLEELRAEFVNERGVIFVGSAGNEGPSLSTVGGPGGTSTAPWGVGAVISPAMMAEQYSVRETHPELAYPWSSRGPAADGYLGVDFCGPGGAISPVPNWSLRYNQLMNGTSMAAPSVCGGTALLLSGLKARGVAYSPHSVRRALANTARKLEGTDPWGQGAGVVQIDRAFDHLVEYAGRDDRDVRYEIAVDERDGARGIYLRDPFENDRPLEVTVEVDPLFPKDYDNRAKVAFEKRVRLEATVPWIDVAESVVLMYGGRGVTLEVDPTGLEEGPHYGEVRGIDDAAPGYGPLFRIPVTVVRTRAVSAETDWATRETIAFRPGRIERRFLAVPEDATWADIRMRRLDKGTARTIVLQTVQLLQDEAWSDHGTETRYSFAEGEEQVRSIEVTGGRTLEVVLSQNWQSLGESELEVEVTFHGLTPSDAELALDTAVSAAPVDVAARLRPEAVSPEGKLSWLRKTLAAKESDVQPLGSERDRLWDGRQEYQLVARFPLKVKEAGDYTIRPAFGFLPFAEDTYESMMWFVLDGNGRRLAVGSGAEWRTAEIGKGDQEIVLHVRHDDPDVLEALAKAPLYVDRKLGKPVSLGLDTDPREAAGGDASFGRRELALDEVTRVWVAPPKPDDWPKDASAGDLLLGSVTYGRSRGELAGAGRRPGGWPVEVLLAPAPEEKKEEPKAKDAEPEKPELEKLAEEVRDLRVERLGKLEGEKNDEAFETLAAEILADWPDWLPVLVARLERRDSEKGKGDTQAIVAAAQAVIDAVDRSALAEYFGTTADDEDPAAREEREKREKERDALREALFRKGRALAVAAAEKPDDEKRMAAFETAWTDYEKWADTDSDEYAELHVDREKLHGRFGTALRLVNERIADEDEPKKDLFEQREELFGKLGWEHWAASEQREIAVRFPATKLVF